MRKYIFSMALLGAISFLLPSEVQAQEVVFEESFSSDLNQWQFLRDDGRYWKIVDQSLESYVPFGSTLTEVVPTAQAWDNSITDYTYEFDFTALQGADKNISFGVLDKNNWYEIHFTPSLTEIARVKNGVAVWSKQTPYVLPHGITQHFSIAFVKGRIVLTIENSVIFDLTDPTFENNYGKIGLKATTGGIFPTRVKFDNVVVKKVADPADQSKNRILGVELIKQTDPLWANLEYDTASHWAASLGTGTGFKDWACNLISQLMLMKYHGITHFSNGEVISPLSLNQWLLDNNGYYNSPLTGNIKRQSISQLSAEISKDTGTPKLEFKYVENNLLETALSEIEQGNPVILELDGHFVVADGFTEDKQDLYIKDPAFEYTKLSDHHLALKSLRLFTPSQTDLSYITVSSGSQITVEITDEKGLKVAGPIYQEMLRAVSNPVHYSPSTFITEVVQPVSGSYQIVVTNTDKQPQLVTITTYTSDARSQVMFNSTLKSGTHQFNLKYDKIEASIIETNQNESITFKQIRKLLRELRKNKDSIETEFADTILNLIASAETLSNSNQRKLIQVIKAALVSAPPLMLPEPTKLLLLDYMQQLLAQLK